MSNAALPSWLQTIQVLAASSIPLVIALTGFFVQKSIANSSTDTQYVSLAISILKEPAQFKDEPLRVWAVGLLQETSPVKIDQGTIAKIRAGELTLSGIAIVGPIAPAIATAPEATATGK